MYIMRVGAAERPRHCAAVKPTLLPLSDRPVSSGPAPTRLPYHRPQSARAPHYRPPSSRTPHQRCSSAVRCCSSHMAVSLRRSSPLSASSTVGSSNALSVSVLPQDGNVQSLSPPVLNLSPGLNPVTMETRQRLSPHYRISPELHVAAAAVQLTGRDHLNESEIRAVRRRHRHDSKSLDEPSCKRPRVSRVEDCLGTDSRSVGQEDLLATAASMDVRVGINPCFPPPPPPLVQRRRYPSSRRMFGGDNHHRSSGYRRASRFSSATAADSLARGGLEHAPGNGAAATAVGEGSELMHVGPWGPGSPTFSALDGSVSSVDGPWQECPSGIPAEHLVTHGSGSAAHYPTSGTRQVPIPVTMGFGGVGLPVTASYGCQPPVQLCAPITSHSPCRQVFPPASAHYPAVCQVPQLNACISYVAPYGSSPSSSHSNLAPAGVVPLHPSSAAAAYHVVHRSPVQHNDGGDYMNCSSTTGARSRPLGPMLPLSRIHSHAAPCAPHLVAPVPAMGLRMQQQSVGGPPPPPMLVTPSRVSAMVPAPAHPSHLAPVVPPSPLLLHFLAMVHAPPPAPYTPSSASSTTAGSAESENYEALLSLAERLGDAKPRGLTRQQLDQLPSYRFTAVEQPSAQLSSCVICMCDFEQRQTLRVLPCSHQFHAKCVDKWLKTNRTCPICRGDTVPYLTSV